MTRNWVDFRTVKAKVSMEMALAQYGVMLHRVNRCHIRGRCPLPTHASKNSAQSFIVNTEKNAWHAIPIRAWRREGVGWEATSLTSLRRWRTARSAPRVFGFKTGLG